MFTLHHLDTNGLLSRDLCPKVYDHVQKIIGDVGVEAQYAVWSWLEVLQDKGKRNWHSCFELPCSRRIVVREEKALSTVAERCEGP